MMISVHMAHTRKPQTIHMQLVSDYNNGNVHKIHVSEQYLSNRCVSNTIHDSKDIFSVHF